MYWTDLYYVLNSRVSVKLMTNTDVPPENESSENESSENEIESPVDGPVPDWMKMATSDSSDPSLTEENVPDWLKDIKSGKGMATEEEADSQSDDDPQTGMSDLERLLAEEGIKLETVDEDRPEGAAGMSIRDWMISTSDDDMIRKIDAAVHDEAPAPTPITEVAPIPPETAEPAPVPTPEPAVAADDEDDKMVVEDGLPDWLRKDDLSPVVAEPSPGQALTPQPVPAVEAEDDKMVVEDDLPDWLREDEDETPVTSELVAVADDDVPEWQSESEEETPPEPVAEAEDDNMVVDDDLPDWLREPEDDTPSALEPVTAADDDLPEWLSQAEAEVM
jgi:hypothetical protein